MRLFVLLILLRLPGGTFSAFFHPIGSCSTFFHPAGICSVKSVPTTATATATATTTATATATATATDSLPLPAQLHAALDSLHHRRLLATLAEFDDAGPKQWMNYVPSVGIGYNLQGQPRPTMSFSLSQVFSAQRQRSDRQAKRRSIESSAVLELERLHSQLDAMLQRYELMSLELATMRKVHDIEASLYELAVMDYEAAKLAPSGFLPKQKAFLESELAVMRKEMEVRGLENEVLEFVGVR
ncbi:MAG: hypothetical protein KDD27_25845 [Saprospiraceae bacterium]|nr:hypothetical protein [Saprospiraceae bacterium]